MSLRGSLRSSEGELTLVQLQFTARREQQSLVEEKKGECRALIPQNRHEKGGSPWLHTGTKKAGSCPTKKQESADFFAF